MDDNMNNEKDKIQKNESIEINNETSLADYHNFNLQALAQKIKMQNYRPKPKMLYY